MANGDKRNPHNQDRLWEKMGEHEGYIKTMQAAIFQSQQDMKMHRHETASSIEKLEGKLVSSISALEDKMKEFFSEIKKDIFEPMKEDSRITKRRVGRIERIMYSIAGGGTVLLGIIYNFDKIQYFARTLIGNG